MRAAYYETFGGPIEIRTVPDPSPERGGVVIRVQANGLCRSDWHGWQGHDADISLPHVPGHELAGVVQAVGDGVRRWRRGDRVTVPFSCGCGDCPQCTSGNHQICDRYFQPGFTGWGSFAELVAIPHADVNLVAIPEAVDDVTAASLGCRFGTAFRAVVDQGRVSPGEWVAVHGCGGVGLSAVMIASAIGANVVAVDIRSEPLALATELGATITINGSSVDDVPAAIRDLTDGGAHVSLDALGSSTTAAASVASLRKRGRHIQVGVMAGADRETPLPLGTIMFNEIEVIGSHGIQPHRYAAIFDMIAGGQLAPGTLVRERISLDDVPGALAAMGDFAAVGVTVVDRLG